MLEPFLPVEGVFEPRIVHYTLTTNMGELRYISALVCQKKESSVITPFVYAIVLTAPAFEFTVSVFQHLIA